MGNKYLEDAIKVGEGLGKYIAAKDNDSLADYLLRVDSKSKLSEVLAHISRVFYFMLEEEIGGEKPTEDEINALEELIEYVAKNEVSFSTVKEIANIIAATAYAKAIQLKKVNKKVK